MSTRRSSHGIYISWLVLPGRMRREFISISGWNSLRMIPARLAKCGFAALYIFSFWLSLSQAHAQTNAQEPQAGAIRVSVVRVDVGVIVTDSRGKFVGGLQRENFHVFDDGVEQSITDFAPIDDPAQVLILIEAGPAVYF